MSGPAGSQDGQVARAESLVALGRHAEARDILAPLAAAPTDVPAVWCLLAVCELGLNEPLRGLAAAEYALFLDPASEWAHRLRSRCLARVGRAREAVAAAGEAVRLAPQSAPAFCVLAEAHLATNRADRALDAACEAVQLAPGLADAHFRVGRITQRLGRYDEAEAAYRRALALDPSHAAARNNLGVVALKRGHSVEAASHFVGSVRADPATAVAAGNVTVAVGVFLTKLSRLTLAVLALSAMLWLVSVTGFGGTWLSDLVRPGIALCALAFVSVVAWRAAVQLPRAVIGPTLRSPRLAGVGLVVGLGLAGCVLFAFAKPVASGQIATALQLLLVANLAVAFANSRAGRGR